MLTRVQCFDKIEFSISKHTLDIIYRYVNVYLISIYLSMEHFSLYISQTVCWMGLFFAPLLSLITFIKLLLIFYIRLSYLKRICKPAKQFYEASRTSSLLNLFLLISFAFSFIPLGYILGEMQPSNACGPFRSTNDFNYYTGVVWNLIEVRKKLTKYICSNIFFQDWSSTTGKDFFLFISQTSVLISTTAGT